MVRRPMLVLLTLSAPAVAAGLLHAQSAFRKPAYLMIEFLNRSQQLAYAVGMSDWAKMSAEAEGLAEGAEAFGKLIPPRIPMTDLLRAFQADARALAGAAGRKDGEKVGELFGRIQAGCLGCHRQYRDL